MRRTVSCKGALDGILSARRGEKKVTGLNVGVFFWTSLGKKPMGAPQTRAAVANGRNTIALKRNKVLVHHPEVCEPYTERTTISCSSCCSYSFYCLLWLLVLSAFGMSTYAVYKVENP